MTWPVRIGNGQTAIVVQALPGSGMGTITYTMPVTDRPRGRYAQRRSPARKDPAKFPNRFHASEDRTVRRRAAGNPSTASAAPTRFDRQLAAVPMSLRPFPGSTS